MMEQEVLEYESGFINIGFKDNGGWQKTNPINPDSDGDGYPDGLEIKTGHNPMGPGKIFETPGSSTSTPITTTTTVTSTPVSATSTL